MNKFLGVIGLCAAAVAVFYNQDRLECNDSMRRIPKEIEDALKHFVFKPTFAELKGQLEFFEVYSVMGLTFEKHRTEFVAELDKQIKMASNG